MMAEYARDGPEILPQVAVEEAEEWPAGERTLSEPETLPQVALEEAAEEILPQAAVEEAAGESDRGGDGSQTAEAGEDGVSTPSVPKAPEPQSQVTEEVHSGGSEVELEAQRAAA